MRGSILILLLVSALLAACGSDTISGDRQEPSATRSPLAVLPATVEGFLTIDVEEGDEDFAGAAEFNFGTLVVGTEQIPVHIGGAVMSSLKLPPAGGKVRATIGSSSHEYGSTNYNVTALQRL